MTHRWMKFWPQDWQADGALRACSLAARGLWMEMLCLAHAAEPYGHVTINGKPATTKQLANIIGAQERDVIRLLVELEEAGVFSRTIEGMIFSRRMVRDAAKSEEGRVAIAKRWGANKGDDTQPTGDPTTHPNRGPDSLYSEAEAEAEKKPLTPSPDGDGGQVDLQSNGRPPGWRGQWRGLRANKTNPRQVAAVEAAAAPPPPDPDHPLWPGFKARGMSAPVFRSMIGKLEPVAPTNGHAVFRAPTRWLRDHVIAEHRIALETVTGHPIEILGPGEEQAHG